MKRRCRPEKRTRKRRRLLIERVDRAVDAGQWTWERGPDGLKFVSRK